MVGINATAKWKCEVFNKCGEKIKEFEKNADSFVDNFAKGVCAILKMPYSSAIVDVNNQPIHGNNEPLYIETPMYLAGSGDSNRGIVLGRDNTSWEHTQYRLLDKITNGIGVGQLNYGAEVLISNTFNPGTNKWTISKYRNFINQSGNTITINELGLELSLGTIGGYRECLVMRDVISSINLPTDNTLKVTLTIEISA